MISNLIKFTTKKKFVLCALYKYDMHLISGLFTAYILVPQFRLATPYYHNPSRHHVLLVHW